MMFIDEGFGSLDPQATENAVRTLNSLASGDRIIGVISHVPELKERIENHIVLTKGINGSTVSVETARCPIENPAKILYNLGIPIETYRRSIYVYT